eukprot:TRINITY_DN80389_c0_g1_i1.p1 TRINITY_DN80389_c0_g1~~TRINITY_DN80389_c0_g1_i1.p1  ORF type:complete len:265 (+),score=53.56 TRINITY_DN80389_c0_g1_i1:121-915(+)
MARLPLPATIGSGEDCIADKGDAACESIRFVGDEEELIANAATGLDDHTTWAEERIRGLVLSWRLKRTYLLYCAACTIMSAFLCGLHVNKGVQHEWDPSRWRHHNWEEALEVTIGACIVVETMLTLRVLGAHAFFRSYWCIFDFLVMILTVVSIIYGLIHLQQEGHSSKPDFPLLVLRFVLQPVRVCGAFAGTVRTRHMQRQVKELIVDFDALPFAASASVRDVALAQVPSNCEYAPRLNSSPSLFDRALGTDTGFELTRKSSD